MGFFNFSKPASDDTNNGDQPVIIQFNEEEITVPAAEAKGKSIEQLFNEFAGDLGYVDEISRFIAAGRIVDKDTAVVPGTIYRGAITSETKGNN